MKKLMVAAACIFLAVTLMSCATYPIPITATGNPMGPKVGKASDNIYFGFFGDASDASIPNAARAGNITKISTVDVQVKNFLNIVQTVTCVVTGE